MKNRPFPEIINAHHADALSRMEEDAELNALYEAEWSLPCEDVRSMLDSSDVDAASDFIAMHQVKTERMGFLLGYRYAMQLAREIFA